MNAPLASRLARLEAMLRDDHERRLVVAFTTDDGGLVTAAGEVVDAATLSPQTTLVVFGLRSDGPK